MVRLRPKKKGTFKKKPLKLDEVRNEINVTPLVDVCLVLLIIFMVVLPLMERGKQIPLPLTEHHVATEDTQQPIVVVTLDGKYYLDKTEVPDLETLKDKVQEEWKALEARNTQLGKKPDERHGEGRVLLKAEVDTMYGKIYPVIMAMHEIGAIGIDLGSNEVKQTAPAQGAE